MCRVCELSEQLAVSLQVCAVSVACCDARGLRGGAHPMSAWACTQRGDVFLHEPEPEAERSGDHASDTVGAAAKM